MTLGHHTTSKSQLDTYGAERKGLGLATAGVFAAGATYIAVMLVALPFAVHKMVNDPTGEGECDGPCFGPTAKSQPVLTNILTTLRLCTFMFGNLLGVLGDKYGRRPVMIGALLGYSVATLVYYFAWQSRSIELFFVGAALLGTASPLNPHGIAYVSDISVPKRAAQNIGILQGFGYFAGLMTGAFIAKLVSSVSIDNAETGTEPGIELYDKLFTNAFFGGFGLSAAFVVVFVLLLPESLHHEERTEVDWKLANPLGIFAVMKRNGYMFFVWLMCFFSWMSVGGGEAVTGGWWLRRYAISDSKVFISYLVVLWVIAGLGAVIMTKIYTMKGLKLGVHLSSIGAIIGAVALSLAPDVPTSYMAAGVGFFGSAAMPIYLTLFMGQASATEKGMFSGTYRTSEALGKIVGIQVMGNLLAAEIQHFVPEQSCVGSEEGCPCGVESCPQRIEGVPTIVPKNCTLGQLSTVWASEGTQAPIPDSFVKFVRPELLADGSKNPDYESCRMPGNRGPGGLKAEINKLWCTGKPEIGCYAPINGLCVAKCYAAENPPDGASATCSTIAGGVGGECAIVESPVFFNYTSEQQLNITREFLQSSDAAGFNQALGLYLAGTYPGEHHCEAEGKWEANLCWIGTISNFPGFIPFLLSVQLMLGYLCFIIAEVFFVAGDARHWIKDEDTKMEEDTELGAPKLESEE
jgi:DHA1 family tetracycline resistance protein-like MFS transporter